MSIRIAGSWAMSTRKLWYALAGMLAVSFGILLFLGRQIYLQAPPVPEQVVATSGRVVFTRTDIERGREVWQTIGGHETGSIWGHGGYIAPDWTADWLHREALATLESKALARHGTPYSDLDTGTRAALESELRTEIRRNTYANGTLVVSDRRAAAIEATGQHYRQLFSGDTALRELRDQYALRENPVPNAEHRRVLTAFFFWTAWAAVTERPNEPITYTNNWPADDLVGNRPSAGAYIWTFVSIFFLLAGIGALAWHHASREGSEAQPDVPAQDPLQALRPTASMRATAKYFWVVAALFVVQVLLGAVTAHYAVEGQAFYGFPLAEVLPYSVTRSWHLQLAVFWIATAWLATGLYVAPAISGHEPKFQRLGVNFLFVCLLIIVVGALAGQWLGVMQKLQPADNFWFGHQGYEFVDIGRFWQAFLFIGLLLWLTLMGRALWPALKRHDENRSLTWIVFLSTIAIGLFYGAGLLWGRNTHLSMVEYWRWWVVHLWVEGFFEVFATAVIAFLFARLGLVRARSATTAVLFATIVFLAGGVLGTLHHLYFAGTPTSVIAFGAAFSALEVVPLALVGFEAYNTWRKTTLRPWVANYRWPILFFVAVSFWNLVGAGLFGFLINPPLALYYMQGLNTTPLHGHTALFGVYGMLGIGLMLFCLRGLKPLAAWNERVLKWGFWSLNVGLAAMALLSLAPIGLLQVYASVTHGFWFARSAEFIHSPLIEWLVWMRVPGDIIFGFGCIAIAGFVFTLWGQRRMQARAELPSPDTAQAR
jgi:nitric oxide reductase subunit B